MQPYPDCGAHSLPLARRLSDTSLARSSSNLAWTRFPTSRRSILTRSRASRSLYSSTDSALSAASGSARCAPPSKLPSTAKADPTYCLGELGTQHLGMAAAFDRVD